MKKYVALLRGINVGGNNKVDMSKLKKCFEMLGYTNVSTYINSGNVIFEASGLDDATLVKNLEQGLKKIFGFDINVVVRDSINIKKLAKEIPATWNNDGTQKTDVIFLRDDFKSKKSLGLLKTTPGVDNLLYVAGAIIWNIDRSMYTKSGMHAFIGTPVYKNMTARNINTLRKLAALL